jgi:GTPase-associated protein 1, N-terminal domain type 1
MNNGNIILNQTLHGYDDGHSLLSASIDLPTASKRTILSTSDMSGSRMQKGFEEYITGYPLKPANIYVLAKTWYAPEMKRPGCVWTHSILIDFQDLPSITNPQALLSLFVRPDITGDIKDPYSKSISFNSLPLMNDTDRMFNLRFALSSLENLIQALYEYNNRSLLIESNSSANFSELFLSVWAQQWPRLKRTFSFCTGALSPRIINGEELDLQVVPQGLYGSKKLENDRKTISMNEVSLESKQPWVNFMTADLIQPSKVAHSFFNFFGSDISVNKTSFKILVNAFLFFRDNRPLLDDSIAFLSKQFPSPKEGANMKATILGVTRNLFATLLPTYSEAGVLTRLATLQNFEPFDYEKLNFRQRFIGFFAELDDSKVKILKAIIQSEPNVEGERAIIEYVEMVSDEISLKLIWSDKQLSSVFLSLNPAFSFNKDFWLANSKNQTEILYQLKRAKIGKTDWKKIADIVFQVNPNIEPKLFENVGLQVASVILDALSKNVADNTSRAWTNYLVSHPREVLDWFNSQKSPTTEIVEFLVNILNPNSPEVIENGLGGWLRFLKNTLVRNGYGVKIDIHFFCLSLAFGVANIDSQNIFEISLQPVYQTLSEENVDYSLWQELEVHTKPLSIWKNWDKCKKLLNAVADIYLQNRWDIETLLLMISNLEIRNLMAQRYKKRR